MLMIVGWHIFLFPLSLFILTTDRLHLSLIITNYSSWENIIFPLLYPFLLMWSCLTVVKWQSSPECLSVFYFKFCQLFRWIFSVSGVTNFCFCFFLFVLQVGWVRIEDKSILTISHQVVTRNSRISLTQSEHKTWTLHIKNVQESDRGGKFDTRDFYYFY